CSSGLASNVMAYLARANLTLSVTVTAITTLLAPVLTPLWMKVLAGSLIEMSFVSMMLEIIEIVLVPIGAALLHDYLNHASARGRRLVLATAAVAAAWLAFLACGGREVVTSSTSGAVTAAAGVLGFLLGAVVVGVGYHAL